MMFGKRLGNILRLPFISFTIFNGRIESRDVFGSHVIVFFLYHKWYVRHTNEDYILIFIL